jgi:hypothetical protein
MDMEAMVNENDKRISVHEAVCEQRYNAILESFANGSKRMQRIEYLLYAVIVSVFFGKDMFVDIIKTFIGK